MVRAPVLGLAGALLVCNGCASTDAAQSIPGDRPEPALDRGHVLAVIDAAEDSDAGVVEVLDAGMITLGTDRDAATADSAPPPDAEPAPSPGRDPCASDAPRGRTGDVLRTIRSAGGTRWYYLHVPPGYSGGRTPVVLNFHGFTSDPFQEALLSRMNAAADARGMIVAYPAGIANGWNAGQCCGVSAWATMVDDVGFVRDTIDAIGREYCVDPRRVFATGMSNGGFLSHRLACEASDRIAAIAPVAGVLGVLPCLPRRPVPVMHFHGTLDPLVSYYGLPLGFTSVPLTFAGWQLRQRCTGPEQVTYARGDARCVARGGCTGGSEVVLCTIDRGGHTWPGGLPIPVLGVTSRYLDATGMMLDFFARHPMP